MLEIDCFYEARAALGESPLWDEDEQALYWVDTVGQTLNCFYTESRAAKTWPMPSDIGCCVLRERGGLVVGVRDGFYGFDPVTETLTLLQSVESKNTDVRLNDGRCDRSGRLWCGTVQIPPVVDIPGGSLYSLESGLVCERRLGGLLITNGIATSLDSRTFYISDSHPSVQTIWAFDFQLETGALKKRREFASTKRLDGRPDGATVDAEGFYWIALIEGGRIARFAPDGTLDRTIHFPVSCPTMCAFGGADLATMFVTTMRPIQMASKEEAVAGNIFAFEPGVRGLAEPKFKG